MVSMSSLDAINIDDGFDERNTVNTGGVWIIKNISLI